MLSDTVRTRAAQVAVEVQKEDGIANGVTAIERLVARGGQVYWEEMRAREVREGVKKRQAWWVLGAVVVGVVATGVVVGVGAGSLRVGRR